MAKNRGVLRRAGTISIGNAGRGGAHHLSAKAFDNRKASSGKLGNRF